MRACCGPKACKARRLIMMLGPHPRACGPARPACNSDSRLYLGISLKVWQFSQKSWTMVTLLKGNNYKNDEFVVNKTAYLKNTSPSVSVPFATGTHLQRPLRGLFSFVLSSLRLDSPSATWYHIKYIYPI